MKNILSTIKIRFLMICAAFKPDVLDTDDLIRNIHDKTGIDIELIKIIIDSEADYLIETGIAYKVE